MTTTYTVFWSADTAGAAFIAGLTTAATPDTAAAPTQAINHGSAHLCIADPLGRRMNLKEGFVSDLFASHPPMAARIAALKEMAFQERPRSA